MGEENNNERDWRQLILTQLTELKNKQDAMLDKLNLMASQAMVQTMENDIRLEINKIADRTTSLEKFQYKLLGIGIAVNSALALYIALKH